MATSKKHTYVRKARERERERGSFLPFHLARGGENFHQELWSRARALSHSAVHDVRSSCARTHLRETCHFRLCVFLTRLSERSTRARSAVSAFSRVFFSAKLRALITHYHCPSKKAGQTLGTAWPGPQCIREPHPTIETKLLSTPSHGETRAIKLLYLWYLLSGMIFYRRHQSLDLPEL